MATTILVASVVIWFLGYFPRTQTLQQVSPDAVSILEADMPSSQLERSYLAQIGKAIEPAMRPMGFDWRLDVGLLTGIVAKELVVSSLGVIMYLQDNPEAVGADNEKITALQAALARSMTFPTAIAYMIFVLLYFPCIATFVAIKNETGKWGWAVAICAYTIAVAWLFSFLGYHIALFF